MHIHTNTCAQSQTKHQTPVHNHTSTCAQSQEKNLCTSTQTITIKTCTITQIHFSLTKKHNTHNQAQIDAYKNYSTCALNVSSLTQTHKRISSKPPDGLGLYRTPAGDITLPHSRTDDESKQIYLNSHLPNQFYFYSLLHIGILTASHTAGRREGCRGEREGKAGRYA